MSLHTTALRSEGAPQNYKGSSHLLAVRLQKHLTCIFAVDNVLQRFLSVEGDCRLQMFACEMCISDDNYSEQLQVRLRSIDLVPRERVKLHASLSHGSE